ncbi:Beta-ketoadipate enol-lactone hydrolase (EC [Olavius algarvensis Delta 1 endosymbiont]|nr:Beta-ketoadipate enol-lactone hydrolase (EC [Olavius algarvensis Delta 1 endosymbiont]
MEILQTGRIEIAYEASGSGDAGVVILIRGQGTQLIHWPASFYDAFSNRGFLTIRFDNRDTGLSTKFDSIAGRELEALKKRLTAGEDIDPPYTMDDMALDVVALMDKLDIETAHIAGISMGGFITQLLAVQYPERVISMTSIMSGSGPVDPALIDSLWSVPSTREAYIQEWVEYIRQFGSKQYFESDEYERRVAAAAFDRCYSPDGANRQLLAIFSRTNPKEAVKSITVPSLVVHGSDDSLISPSRGRETASLVPGATFQLVDGMGHDIPPRLGEPLAEIVLRHILSTANRKA